MMVLFIFIEERELKTRIKELFHLRKNGITKLEGKAHETLVLLYCVPSHNNTVQFSLNVHQSKLN
jgi:hypothetical protein